MKTNHIALAVVVLLCFSLAAGCRSINVESYPPDAKILIDGVATGERTPHRYSVRQFNTGYHTVSVEKDGYKKPNPQGFNIGISIGDVIWSIFPPVFFKNLIHDHWKKVSNSPDPFELIGTEQQPSKDGAAQSSKEGTEQPSKDGPAATPSAGRWR